ncbi:MAG: Ig-like domain-containing protein [Bacteroidaceae bacterium]|nr:Ig-like domain-containing protein [Bacteroidaceae bacterium]
MYSATPAGPADSRAATTVAISDAALTNTNLFAGTAAGSLSATVSAGGSPIDASVTWTSSSESVATIAANGAVTLVGTGTTTITASYAGDEDNYKPSSDTYELTVTNSDPDLGKTESKAYTVAQAKYAIDNDGNVTDVYVKGIVCTAGSNYYDSSKLNYWISDDGTTTNRFEIYRGTGLNGAAFSGTSDIQVGDIVTVKGSITLYNSTTYEFSEGSQLVSFKRKTVPALSFDETSFTVLPGADFDAPSLNNEEDVTVVYSTSDADVASVNASTGAVTVGTKVGTATITATFSGNDDYKPNTATYTITTQKGDADLSFAQTAFTVNTDADFDAPVLTNPHGLTITYSSSDEDLALVGENDGTIIIGSTAGVVTITATAAANTQYNGGTATYTITVTDAPINTVSFSVNGEVTSTADFAQGATIVFPSDPAGIGGLTFLGWSATAANPVVLTVAQTMGDAAKTFYAVFGKADDQQVTAHLTSTELTTNITNTTCAYGTEKKYDDTTDGIVWNLSGYTDAASRPWLQMKKDNTSYIKVEADANIQEVVLTITSATNSKGGITDISKHTAFSGSVYLESEAKSSPSGTLGSSNIVTDNKITITPTSSAKVIYIQVSTGARVWDIDVTYGSVTYTGLTTTISESVTVGDAGYTSYVPSYDISIPSSVKAYIATATSSSTVTLTEVADAPAGAALVIKADPGTYAMEFDYAGLYDEQADDTPNLLQASDGTVKGDLSTIYALGKKDGKVGFYLVADGVAVPEGKAYLEVAGAGVKEFLSFDFDLPTGIEAVESSELTVDNKVIYNLAGQRVDNSQFTIHNSQLKRGIYIVNGKKVLVK